MALALVGLGNGEDLGPLGLGHLGGQVGLVPVVERAALPEGIEHVAVVGLVLLGHLEGVLRAGRELVEFVQDPVGRHLGREDAGARGGRAVAYQKVVVVQHKLVVLQQVAEGQGAAHDHRLALGLPVALHVEGGALQRDLAGVREEAVLDALGACGEHGVPFLGVRT